LLVELRERLLASRATVVQALHGMGGIGKTQLAIEYAYRFASDYDLVWWIPASQPTLLTESLHQLAEQLGVTVDEQNTAAVLEAVKNQLRQRHRWLLIFDNAEEPAELASYRPGGDGHMVITSRNPGWGDIAGRLEVDVFTRAESIALLRTRASGLRENDADRLAGAVGDLPLALTQAAALLDETGMAPDAYLELLVAQTRELLNEGAPITYPASLAASLQVTLNRIQSEDPAAVCLLELAAFLAPEPIPLSLIADHADQLVEPLASAARTPLAFRRGLRLIGRYALGRIQRDSLQLHRLVQAVLRDRLDDPQRRGLCRRAQNLFVSLPGDPGDPASWPSYARLTPHILAIWEQVGHVGTHSFRQTILEVARYLERSGQHNTCRQLTDQAWRQWKLHLGSSYRDTLAAAHRLAAALRVLGDYEQARPVAEETLARRRHMLGDDDPDTLSSASNLGATLNGLGEYRTAYHLAEDTLNRRRRVLGQDHPNTLVSEHNLGLSHQGLGNWEQARQVHQDALTRRRRLLGDDHPDTLASAYSLAVDLREAGKAWSARKLDEETLARRRRVLGEEHPDTLNSANNLAVDLYTLGEPKAARELDEATLVLMRHVLGNGHPQTDEVRRRLGTAE
jgi:tetratricopeptide (TPR) repeat protein